MHILSDVQKRVQDFVSENSTTLLTAGGVVGTVATGILAWRGGFNAACHVHGEALQTPPDDRTVGEDLAGLPDFTFAEKAQMVWKYSVPPIFTGGATLTAIVFAHKMNAQRAAALAAAYGLSQKQFEEYREKVAEKLTGPKKQQIDDELAQERVSRAQGAQNIVIISGDDVLCFDEPTGRFFKSTMEKIQTAVNSTNQEILNHGSAPASYFYDELELPPTTWASDVGWNLDNMVELSVSTTQAEDGRPCLSINFVRFPIEDYHRSLYN